MTMTLDLANVRVVDTDTHVTEPEDLWTSRVPAAMRSSVPSVGVHPSTGNRHWRIGDHWVESVGYFACAGWDRYPPDNPVEYDDIDPGAWQAGPRLERMDEYGIYAQVLYPNLIGFEAPLFIGLGSDVSLACTRAYNDFITEFAEADPQRLLPMTMVPFWDVEASLAEIERCYEMGHRGVLFGNKYDRIGFPGFTDAHWDPIYALAQEMGQSVNYHIGFSSVEGGAAKSRMDKIAEFEIGLQTRWTSSVIMSNADCIAEIVTSGVCDRFPGVDFVSVESGFGFVPYLLESLDWHWKSFGAHLTSDLLPSEYFKRQCYGTFWFERDTLSLLELYPDNFMFETDFPHQTGLSPGPCSPAQAPRDHIPAAFANVSPETAYKALHANAARLYRIPSN